MSSSSFGKIALFCFLLPHSALGWWETGHQAVARIAAAHLTPAAQTRIARILSVPDSPGAVADALAAASTWADETRAQTQTGSWHYIDLAIQDQKYDIPERCRDNNCVTARIRLFALQLSSHPANPPVSELDALRYLVHFVGDVHQPLHAVSDADLGGNCEHVDPPVGSAKNLHAVWDGAIVKAIDRSERQLAADLNRRIDASTTAEQAALSTGNPDDWAWESHELAIQDVYQKLSIPVEPVLFPTSCAEAPLAVSNLTLQIRSSYIQEMEPVVRQQLTKAGLRLARLLNESL